MSHLDIDHSASTTSDPLDPSPRVVKVDATAASEALPGWDYADAFECPWRFDGSVDVMIVARALLGSSPSARRVLTLRDLLVRPFGLRRAHQGEELVLPVLTLAPGRVVCGFDDCHLDFRVVITVSAGVARCMTVVRRHGRSGTAYFALVGPLHRRLVPRLMRRGQTRQRLEEVLAK